MKDKLKGLIIGMAIGTVVTGATAYAAGGKMIEVFYSVNDIKVDHISKMPKGDLKPFLYNGTTFVPLAFMSNALGQPVKWDAKNKTVLIGEDHGGKIIYPGKDIKPINTQSALGIYNTFEVVYDGPIATDNIGNEYSNYHTYSLSSNRDNWIYDEYYLNGQYSEFKATVGLFERFKSTRETLTLTINLDGKEAYSGDFKAGDPPAEINVNLKNASKMKIQVSNGDGTDMSALGLFDGYFTK
ncbi:NPCBM/NEW2 domain-containing protein [Paenibacillus taichungensis]|uniref:stalk domain-containing protein n=1 Tax=Paenibacillus taichungensis TaxID=484184 RepID=UPI002DBCCB38|nr:NPCBM/NEW2 domain-containing protein [Paenibacillus taichungensis]MEC0105348.1 NPCBM/NEW2 domain-containing protein [Paenibacillus taichungensis]MEC0200423.1 NPCBM/NEW2 domain-containing protein [Paenibacillus taichungensis]